MTNARAFRILAIALLALIFWACNFEPNIAPLELEQAPEQPAFGPIDAESDEEERFPGEALTRRLDDVFDPYYLGEDMVYEGSVYQQMDEILAGAYEYFGYDLAKIAALREPNPLTESQFFDYLTETGQHTVFHPDTEEEIGVYEWMQRRLGMTAGSAHSLALDQFDEGYKNDYMNFEVNYLAAMYAGSPERVIVARLTLRERLQDLYGDDAAAMQEYLDSLEPVGTE